MSKHIHIYKMDWTRYVMYKRRDGRVECYSCGKEIKVGDEVVSKGRAGGRSRGTSCRYTVIRCINCARRLNII